MYNVLDFILEELQNWMKENGESAFRAKQVFSWIYKNIWNFYEIQTWKFNMYIYSSWL